MPDKETFPMSTNHETVIKKEAEDVSMPSTIPGDSSVVAAAIVAADKRAEERMVQFAGQIASQLAMIHEDNAALKKTLKKMEEDNTTLTQSTTALQDSVRQIKEENALLRKHVEKLTEAETAREGATKRARIEASLLHDEVRAVATSLERVHAITSLPQNPTRPDMTVATPCGPSVFAISYPEGGKNVVINRRESWSLLGKFPRPVYFPNARISAGSRCMIEFEIWTAHNAVEASVSLRFGFTPVNTKGLSHPNHAIADEGECFWLSVFGEHLSKGNTKLSTLPKRSGQHRFALLMDRTHASHSTLRVYIGSETAQMKAFGNEVVIRHPNVDYIPVANPFGECNFIVRNILYGNQIEFGWKATQ